MSIERIAVCAAFLLAWSGVAFAGVSVEDPDVDLTDRSGLGSSLASGTNLAGVASGVYDDFTIDTDAPVCRNPGPSFGNACTTDPECDALPGDGDCGPPRSAENGAETLTVVVTIRSGNQKEVFGDTLQCPFAGAACGEPNADPCACICSDDHPDRIDRAQVVDTALCIESRLGAEIAAAFGKLGSMAVLKKFSRPVEEITDPLERTYWSSDLEVSLPK